MKLILKLRLHKVIEYCNSIIKAESTVSEARFKPQYFTRDRKMGFCESVYFMLNMAKEGTQTALNRFFKGTDIHISQQAFSKLRNKYDHTPFLKLFNAVSELLYNGEHLIETFKGYRVSAVDGTIIALPNVPQLLVEFGGNGPKSESPAARASIHYDILNDMIIDAGIDKLSKSEAEFAKEHVEKISILADGIKDLTIFDRGYASKSLISLFCSLDKCFLMRLRTKFNKTIDDLPNGIHKIAYAIEKGTIELTVAKFALKSGIIETLITNIPEKLTIEEFEQLYFLRWPIETKIDIVKNKLEIENFSGLNKNAILQDFYTSLHLANVLSVATGQANEIVDREKNQKGNKYKQKVNINQAIGTFKDDFIAACLAKNKNIRARKSTQIILALSSATIPIRPNRTVQRELSTRKAKHHHNHKSTC